VCFNEKKIKHVSLLLLFMIGLTIATYYLNRINN